MEDHEIHLVLSGPPTVAKSHLAETLQDILLHLGYQVEPDPHHGFFTPAAMRMKPTDPFPAIRIVEEVPQP